jgi:hypothetical protein
VIIAYDADAVSKELVRISRSELAAHLRARRALVGFLEWDGSQGKGIDDHLAAVGPDAVLAALVHVDFAGGSWKRDLLRARPSMNATEGRILLVLANAIAAFRHAPEWGGVRASYEFGLGIVVLQPTPWGVVPKGEWTDHEDRLAADWLQRQGILVSVKVAGQAVQTAVRDHPFHPVKTYLQALRWDGITAFRPLAGAVPRRGRHETLACDGLALAHFRRGSDLSTGRQGGLLFDPGRAAAHLQVNYTAQPCRGVLQRRTGRPGQQGRRHANPRRLDH